MQLNGSTWISINKGCINISQVDECDDNLPGAMISITLDEEAIDNLLIKLKEHYDQLH